jgi:hypothetical protein
MTEQQQTITLARQLYMKLPFWKRALFRKWHKSNGWDVKWIYESCITEAEGIIHTEKNHFWNKYESIFNPNN